jgi:hypothetical protein
MQMDENVQTVTLERVISDEEFDAIYAHQFQHYDPFDPILRVYLLAIVSAAIKHDRRKREWPEIIGE